MKGQKVPYWALDEAELLRRFASTRDGLSTAEAERRRALHGPNLLSDERGLSFLRVLWNQLKNPLLLLLLFAVGVSGLTGEWSDAAIVLSIVLITVWIGCAREYGAESAIALLRERVRTRANVVRDGVMRSVPAAELVPGDLVVLAAGDLVPADARLLEAADCHVSEAVLTGESYPTQKSSAPLDPGTPLAGRKNSVFLGTNVQSGSARGLVVDTGPRTEFGAIAERLTLRPPDTEFERGVRRFGYLLTTAMLIMVLLVFVAHVVRGRPPVETLLFAIALAVGLSPELLPAILSVNLARGAKAMAKQGVLVRRLNAIENLGSMDVLCTDKTGTITEGAIQLGGAYDPRGEPSDAVLELAALNAALETGLPNPLDAALLGARTPELAPVTKLGEIPFDFVRKRVSVIVSGAGGPRLVTKGAVRQVVDACERTAEGPLDEAASAAIDRLLDEHASRGVRVLAVATRALPEKPEYGREDEHALVLEGFVTFLDHPKAGTREALRDLAELGVAVKLITGDSKLVARHVASLVGMPHERIITGQELDELHDEALWHTAERTDLFVEVDPNQKERVILALKKMGHVVGFMGDGVNDAPAMHAADTSLSVESAVDVARQAADFVLLERDLDVIRRGIQEGRRTFANTLKYLLMTTSANLGNMVSMALASLFLPFLPLLAGQVLLNNLLSDIPAIGLAEDNVDPELVARPRRFSLPFIARFMTEFGLLSSVFDCVTFGALLLAFRGSVAHFRTGWFVESLLSELVVALLLRTERPAFKSRPGRVLLYSTLALIPITLMIPYLPFADALGFVPLPFGLILSLAAITVFYAGATEALKHRFYRARGAAT